MIIDSHIHLMGEDVPSKAYWDTQGRVIAEMANRPIEKVRTWFPQQWDISGDLLVSDMDAAGIDQSWGMTMDLGLMEGMAGKYSVEELNKIYAQAAQKYPGRIIAFCGVDPRRGEDAVRILEKGVKEWGMKGLKLLPPTGFYPDDRQYYPLYQKAQELRIPVLIHAGPELYPMRSKYARPVFVDEVAADFPELTIIMAHGGYPCWCEEGAWVASYKPNIYIDLANWQSTLLHRPVDDFYRVLRKMLDVIGAPRIMFGSDWPGLRATRLNNVTWVKAFTEIPESVKEAGIEFSEEEIQAILGGNAAKIMEAVPKY